MMPHRPIDGARRRKRGEEHTYTEADQNDLVHLSLLFDFDAASSANVRGSMLRANLDSRELDVVSLARTISSPGAHCSVANALTVTCGGAWRVAEPTTELSCKMSVVAKAAGIGNLAERLACVQQRPAMQKARGAIQTKHLRCCVRNVV
jgi:hypothetical protein